MEFGNSFGTIQKQGRYRDLIKVRDPGKGPMRRICWMAGMHIDLRFKSCLPGESVLLLDKDGFDDSNTRQDNEGCGD
jgi:hypothetical protein